MDSDKDCVELVRALATKTSKTWIITLVKHVEIRSQ